MIVHDRASQRLYIQGRHLHHGLTGMVLAAMGLVIPGYPGALVFGVGVALMYHDWPDRRNWLPDILVPE